MRLVVEMREVLLRRVAGVVVHLVVVVYVLLGVLTSHVKLCDPREFGPLQVLLPFDEVLFLESVEFISLGQGFAIVYVV